MFQSFSHNLQPVTFELAAGVVQQMAGNKRAIMFSNPNIQVLTGKELAEDADIIPANKVIQLVYGSVQIKRCEAMLTINPVLLSYALVSYPQILLCQSITGPLQDKQLLSITLNTFKQLPISLLRDGWTVAVSAPL